MNNCSNAIKYKLGFLKLTCAGKARLSIFDDKVIYKAMDKFSELYFNIPKEPFSIYYALCCLMADKLGLTYTDDIDNCDSVTLSGEVFNLDVSTDHFNTFKKMNIKINTQPRGTFSNAHKEQKKKICRNIRTFDQGLKYIINGQEYSHPDIKG